MIGRIPSTLGPFCAGLWLWPWYLELWRAWQTPQLFHGPVALVLGIWLCHRQVKGLSANPHFLLKVLSLVMSALAIVSLWGLNRYFLAMAFFMLSIWTAIGANFGVASLKITWQGLMVIALGLPLLSQKGFGLLAIGVVPLSQFVAFGSTILLKAWGLEILREGAKLFVEGGVITVGLHCAGIQYLEVFGILVFLSWSIRGLPKFWGAYFPLLVAAILMVNILRVFVVVCLSLQVGHQHIALIDQITGVLFMFLLLPILWKWPVVSVPETKGTKS